MGFLVPQVSTPSGQPPPPPSNQPENFQTQPFTHNSDPDAGTDERWTQSEVVSRNDEGASSSGWPCKEEMGEGRPVV